MSISRQQVYKLADLAKLNIEEETAAKLTEQLQGILSLIEEIKAAETKNVEPIAHSLETSLSLRKDKVTEKNKREVFQKLATLTEAGLYLVPKVIE
jgi:aspartyl-tRNA(Asn)/glutamyl-tRNA(Gln) amidotransferase subunit C